MLPRALDALCEVLQAQFLPARVEKERAAVLSEMSMVNTIEYRVECQILRTLHAENALARRFPIGLEEQIKGWSVDDVVKFHSEHYRPDNALLYVVGDVKADDVELAIRTAFDGVPKATSPNPVPPCLKAQSAPMATPALWVTSVWVGPVRHPHSTAMMRIFAPTMCASPVSLV